MDQKLKARIAGPLGVKREVDADMVILPGSEGELGVMYNHIPMIVQLKAGDVRVHNGSNIETISIGKGIAVINATSVDIVCE